MATSVYSLTIAYNVEGQFAQNILHFQFDDAGFTSTFAAAEALITAWNAASSVALTQMLPVGTVLLSAKSRKVSGPGGFDALNLYAAGTHGTRTGPVEVAATGPVLIFYEALNGKRRGKMFLPGITESDCADGVMTAALEAVLATNANTIIQNVTLVGGGAPTASAVIYTRATKTGHLIGNAGYSLKIGTQRRRQIPF
jgi:hypothetical protein